MYNTRIEKKTLHFISPAGTSRGVYLEHDIWLVYITSDKYPGRTGVGECAPLPDLSYDASPYYEDRLRSLCSLFEQTGKLDCSLMRNYPSMLFGLETALLSLERGDRLFDTPFSNGEEGIPINGLVWMGSFEKMNERMAKKIEQGFTCIKLKIGAIDFSSELSLIKAIRSRFSGNCMELRVDANGGFSVEQAPKILEELSKYDIHSIEQPIRQKQWREMSRLCASTPMPIALDEELIGVVASDMKEELLDVIKPQYIVVKPSLHGGIAGSREWIKMAQARGIGSWMTSALEGSVGLSSVAQLAADIYGPNISMPQGLGTGMLYKDNLPARTEIRGNEVWLIRK